VTYTSRVAEILEVTELVYAQCEKKILSTLILQDLKYTIQSKKYVSAMTKVLTRERTYIHTCQSYVHMPCTNGASVV